MREAKSVFDPILIMPICNGACWLRKESHLTTKAAYHCLDTGGEGKRELTRILPGMLSTQKTQEESFTDSFACISG
jgi:hypothetical protein